MVPADLEKVIDDAWRATERVPGYLLENEARFLGVLAALTPAVGAIVEIGSFRGRSTVMLAKVAAHYGLGPVVAIDPHNSPILLPTQGGEKRSSYDDFLANIAEAGVAEHVEPHLAYSQEVSVRWSRPIRMLWIDGDHSYAGAKADFEGFLPFVADKGVVALHDTLSNFEGPLRIFVEEILRPEKFGAAGLVHSISWAQLRPRDARAFAGERKALERRAARLMKLLRPERELRGLEKMRFQLVRSRIPRFPLPHQSWAKMLDPAERN